MSNYPLGAENDPKAPYNQDFKTVEVTISQTLSITDYIDIPINADETDEKVLVEAVKDQILLPSESLENEGYLGWTVDDFCVTI